MEAAAPLWEESGEDVDPPAPVHASEDTPSPGTIARVLIDTDLPHLDRLFDYRIGSKVRDQAHQRGCELGPGMLVRVRFAGRLLNAWIVEIKNQSDFAGKLSALERVVSWEPVVSAQMLSLARHLAARYAVAVVTVLKAMMPARHAQAERKVLSRLANRGAKLTFEDTAADPAVLGQTPGTGEEAEHSYPADTAPSGSVGEAGRPAAGLSSYWSAEGPDGFLASLTRGELVRVMWNTAPGIYPAWGENREVLSEAIAAAIESGGAAIVVLPHADAVRALERTLQRYFKADLIATHLPDDSAAKRWETFLLERSGQVRVVIGTRSAIWAPLAQLRAIFIADCGNDLLTDPQAPYIPVLDVGVRRSHLQRVSLICLGPSSTVAQAGLVASGWAQVVGLDLVALRQHSGQIEVFDHRERERFGSAGAGYLPAQLQGRIRQALQSEKGPVLVHVPSRGWTATVVCASCYQLAHCPVCSGPLWAAQSGKLHCSWCGTSATWQCSECGSEQWRSRRVGSERAAQELTRVFSDYDVLLSDAEHGIVRELSDRWQLVVATPDSEPVAPAGYCLAVVLDATAIANRPELWAPQETVRRWLQVHSLVASDGQLIVVGLEDTTMASYLVRRDGFGFAQHLLSEREQLHFYPAATVVALEGNAPDVEQMLEQLQLRPPEELIGVVPMSGRDIPRRAGEQPTRALLRTENAHASELIEQIWKTQQRRSKQRAGLVTVRLNPPTLV